MSFEDVPAFSPHDSESDESDIQAPKPKRKRGKGLQWKLVSDVPNALASLQEEQSWSIKYTKHTHEGKKVTYQCKLGKDCEARRQILYPVRGEPLLFKGEEEHSEHNIVPRGIPCVQLGNFRG